jgi:hypothetical protein
MDDLKIRLRATQIRKQLRSRHNSRVFLDILENLSDSELCQKTDDHHNASIKWVSEKSQHPGGEASPLIPLSE